MRLAAHRWARLVRNHGGFDGSGLQQIEQAIALGEAQHDAELRFVVEAGLGSDDVWDRVTPRARATALFAQLGLWDTERNNGVLLYVCMADHAVEIVADRDAARRVPAARWQSICSEMTQAFGAPTTPAKRLAGVLNAIARIHLELAPHYPPMAENPNELPNRPLIL
jgi:uncharacterized membrane protein